MHKYVIMGIQGSGKGTQAQLLAAELDLVHISVGDIFRWNVEHHTKLGAQVRRIMAAGELVDDELVETIVRQRLQDHDWNYGFIIDGFPRNVRQAEFFLESYDLDAVILLELPDEEVASAGSVTADLRLMRTRLQRGRPASRGERDLRHLRRPARDARGRQPGSAGGPAAGLSREDATDHRAVRAQGVRAADRRQTGHPGDPRARSAASSDRRPIPSASGTRARLGAPSD